MSRRGPAAPQKYRHGVRARLQAPGLGPRPPRKARAREWRALRARHLMRHPACSVCGSTTNLQVHHRLPVSTHPGLELVPLNLETLCGPRPGWEGCHRRRHRAMRATP